MTYLASDDSKALARMMEKAGTIKRAKSVKLKEPEGFRGKLRPFQRQGVAFLYYSPKAFLLDVPGAGKTVQALALLQLLKARGELGFFVIVTIASGVLQWSDEIRRFTDLEVAVLMGSPAQRRRKYASANTLFGAEGILLGYPTLLKDRDIIQELAPEILILDESGYFRNHSTKTAQAVKAITARAGRVVLMTATPVQNALADMHGQFEALHVPVFGSLGDFRRRYQIEEHIDVRKNGRRYCFTKVLGYENVDEFVELSSPYFLRRSFAQVAKELPDLVVKDVWLDLSPQQRKKYNQIRSGVLERWGQRRVVDILASMHYLQQACDTLWNFGERDVSSKLDWLITFIRSHSAKVVVFARYLKTLEAFGHRLSAVGIGWQKITGSNSKVERHKAVKRFWGDNRVRVLMGTAALEMCLNLQCALYMVAIDQYYNPARTEQLVGRIRRMGSEHDSVVLVNLLAENTLEAKIRDLLNKKQALSDYLFGERSDIFQQLTKEQLRGLIR